MLFKKDIKLKFKANKRVYILASVLTALLVLLIGKNVGVFSGFSGEYDIKQKESELFKYRMLVSRSAETSVSENISSYFKTAGDISSEMMIFASEVESISKEAGVEIINLQPSGADGKNDILCLSMNIECGASFEDTVKFLYHLRYSGKLYEVNYLEILPDADNKLKFKLGLNKSFLR
jgi:hypothetical protein